MRRNTKNNFSFEKGFRQINRSLKKAVQVEIMEALGLKSKGSWYRRLYGIIEPTLTEAKAIDSVFVKYGITDIWERSENK